jgi:hypothetical protein
MTERIVSRTLFHFAKSLCRVASEDAERCGHGVRDIEANLGTEIGTWAINWRRSGRWTSPSPAAENRQIPHTRVRAGEVLIINLAGSLALVTLEGARMKGSLCWGYEQQKEVYPCHNQV